MCYYLIIIRGLCITTTALSGISVTTIHPAPILTLLPMVMLPMIFAPAPIKTLFFIIGAPPFSLLVIVSDPIVTCCIIVQLSPIEHHLEKKQPIGPCGKIILLLIMLSNGKKDE